MPNSETGAFSSGHQNAGSGGPSQVQQWETAIRAGKAVSAVMLRSGGEGTQTQRNTLADALDAAQQYENWKGKSDGGWGYGSATTTDTESGHQFMDWSARGRKQLGAEVLRQMASNYPNGKALLPAGGAGAIPLLPAEISTMPRRVTNLLSLIPTISLTGTNQVSYIRQSTRTNMAAPVAPGNVKPTSIYGIVKVIADLVVLATLSEPVDRFILEDSASLTTFLGQEMGYGIQLVLEDQLLNGSGTAPNMRGFLQTSGIQLQSAGVDAVSTLRQGITRLETAGFTGDLVVALNPNDWERIDLTRTDSSGFFETAPGFSPVNRASQAIWGVPVALSNSLAAGTACIFSQSAVGYYYDAKQIQVDFFSPGDLWSKNQVQARAEGRYVAAVYQPLGIVRVTLPAAV